MGLPKPAEDNVNLTQKDLEQTKDMQKLTQDITAIIQEQENEVVRFYKHFEAFEAWMQHNLPDVEKLKGMMLDKLQFLRMHVEKTIRILQNVSAMTQNQERLGSRKIMTLLEIANDFSTEIGFAEQLKYPKDLIKLAQGIVKSLKKTEESANEDLKLEKRTEELLLTIIDMLRHIQQRLSDFEGWALSHEMTNVKEHFHSLVDYISKEKAAMDKLSELEKIHLHLLMQLFDEEKDAVAQESIYADDEKQIAQNQGQGN